MSDLNLMLCLATTLTIAAGAVGLIIGIWIGRHTVPGSGKPLGKLFVERIDVEPYVTGCWLGVENQEDIKKLNREGQIVTFIVSIEHHSSSDYERMC